MAIQEKRLADPYTESLTRSALIEQFLRAKDKFGKSKTYFPRLWHVNRGTQLALRVLFTGVNNTRVEGMKHLDEFVNDQTAKKVIIGRHQVHPDHVIFRQCLEEAGRGKVADNTSFAAGIKMWMVGTAAFMRAENCFPIPTTHEIAGTAGWLMEHPDEDPNKVSKVQNYMRLQRLLAIAGLKSAGEIWKKGGYLVVYPEGGRTYDRGGYIDWALDSAATYVDRKEDTLVLPTALSSNIQRIFPRGKVPRPFQYPPEEITLSIGPAFRGSLVRNIDRTLHLDEDHFANRGTALMAAIAQINMNMVAPEQRGFYQAVYDSMNRQSLIVQ